MGITLDGRNPKAGEHGFRVDRWNVRALRSGPVAGRGGISVGVGWDGDRSWGRNRGIQSTWKPRIVSIPTRGATAVSVPRGINHGRRMSESPANRRRTRRAVGERLQVREFEGTRARALDTPGRNLERDGPPARPWRRDDGRRVRKPSGRGEGMGTVLRSEGRPRDPPVRGESGTGEANSRTRRLGSPVRGEGGSTGLPGRLDGTDRGNGESGRGVPRPDESFG